MRLHSRGIGQRVAAIKTPILAKHITPGCTGTVVELRGWRAFGIQFDGLATVVPCFPEDLARITDTAPVVPAAPRFKPRGKFAAPR